MIGRNKLKGLVIAVQFQPLCFIILLVGLGLTVAIFRIFSTDHGNLVRCIAFFFLLAVMVRLVNDRIQRFEWIIQIIPVQFDGIVRISAEIIVVHIITDGHLRIVIHAAGITVPVTHLL